MGHWGSGTAEVAFVGEVVGGHVDWCISLYVDFGLVDIKCIKELVGWYQR